MSFNPNPAVSVVFSLSGEIPVTSILLFPPWCAWLYCLILKTFPEYSSEMRVDEDTVEVAVVLDDSELGFV